MKTAVLSIVAYCLIGIFTFGYSFNHFAVTYTAFGQTLTRSDEQRAMGALLCAMVWPLYLSVQLQEPKQ